MFECNGRDRCQPRLNSRQFPGEAVEEGDASLENRVKLLELQMPVARDQPSLRDLLRLLEKSLDDGLGKLEDRIQELEETNCKHHLSGSEMSENQGKLEGRIAALEEDAVAARKILEKRVETLVGDLHAANMLEARLEAVEVWILDEENRAADLKVEAAAKTEAETMVEAQASEDERDQELKSEIRVQEQQDKLLRVIAQVEDHACSSSVTPQGGKTSDDVDISDAHETKSHQLDRSISVILEKTYTHQLEANVWESAIFIGLDEMHWRGSILLLIALIDNIIMQSLFSLIIARTFPSQPVDVDAMDEWRHMIGHHISQVDAFGHSLVSRLCGFHSTLTVATAQDNILSNAGLYVDRGFDGPVLCCLVIKIWYMLWLQDAERTLLIMSQLWMIPSSDTTLSLCNDETAGKVWFFTSLSPARKSFASFVCLVRLAVATILLSRGTLWLVYTTSITDLVLNAVALEFIYDIDEMLFEILAPGLVKSMLAQVRIYRKTIPIAGKDTMRNCLYVFKWCAHILSIVGFTLIIGFALVSSNADTLTDVIKTTCHGEKDVAIGHHEDLHIIYYAPTRPLSAASERNSASWRALDEIINFEAVTSASLLPDIATMKSFLAKGASEVGDELMGSCRDSTPSDLPLYWQRMRYDLRTPEASSCEDVSTGCGSPSVHLVRMLCPETCRCFYAKPSIATSKGCPYWTCQDNAATAGYYDATLSCTDDSVLSLTTNTHWHGYWKSLNATKSLEGSTDFGEVADFALKAGCSVVAKYQLFEEVCAQVSNRHSLGTFCPEACDCQNNDFWGCPRHCYN